MKRNGPNQRNPMKLKKNSNLDYLANVTLTLVNRNEIVNGNGKEARVRRQDGKMASRIRNAELKNPP
jgi:hypothetical protein